MNFGTRWTSWEKWDIIQRDLVEIISNYFGYRLKDPKRRSWLIKIAEKGTKGRRNLSEINHVYLEIIVRVAD